MSDEALIRQVGEHDTSESEMVWYLVQRPDDVRWRWDRHHEDMKTSD